MRKKLVVLLLSACLSSMLPAEIMPYAAESAGEGTIAGQQVQGDSQAPSEGTYSPDDIKKMIDALPDVSAVTDSDRAGVEQAASLYDALPDADKVHVTNASKLRELENVYEIKDAQQRGEEKENAKESNTSSTESQERAAVANTEFSVQMDEAMKSVTVLLHYEYDVDGDGVNDTPDVTLTSPAGSVIRLQQGYPVISRTDITAQVVFSDSQTEIDIKTADSGIWTVKSSIPVVFETTTYREPASNLSEGTEGKTQEKTKKINVQAIVWLAVLLAVCIASTVYKNKSKKKAQEAEKQRLGRDDDFVKKNSLFDQIAEDAHKYHIPYPYGDTKPADNDIPADKGKDTTQRTTDDTTDDPLEEAVSGENTTDFRKLQRQFAQMSNAGAQNQKPDENEGSGSAHVRPEDQKQDSMRKDIDPAEAESHGNAYKYESTGGCEEKTVQEPAVQAHGKKHFRRR